MFCVTYCSNLILTYLIKRIKRGDFLQVYCLLPSLFLTLQLCPYMHCLELFFRNMVLLKVLSLNTLLKIFVFMNLQSVWSSFSLGLPYTQKRGTALSLSNAITACEKFITFFTFFTFIQRNIFMYCLFF